MLSVISSVCHVSTYVVHTCLLLEEAAIGYLSVSKGKSLAGSTILLAHIKSLLRRKLEFLLRVVALLRQLVQSQAVS